MQIVSLLCPHVSSNIYSIGPQRNSGIHRVVLNFLFSRNKSNYWFCAGSFRSHCRRRIVIVYLDWMASGQMLTFISILAGTAENNWRYWWHLSPTGKCHKHKREFHFTCGKQLLISYETIAKPNYHKTESKRRFATSGTNSDGGQPHQTPFSLCILYFIYSVSIWWNYSLSVFHFDVQLPSRTRHRCFNRKRSFLNSLSLSLSFASFGRIYHTISSIIQTYRCTSDICIYFSSSSSSCCFLFSDMTICMEWAKRCLIGKHWRQAHIHPTTSFETIARSFSFIFFVDVASAFFESCGVRSSQRKFRRTIFHCRLSFLRFSCCRARSQIDVCALSLGVPLHATIDGDVMVLDAKCEMKKPITWRRYSFSYYRFILRAASPFFSFHIVEAKQWNIEFTQGIYAMHVAGNECNIHQTYYTAMHPGQKWQEWRIFTLAHIEICRKKSVVDFLSAQIVCDRPKLFRFSVSNIWKKCCRVAPCPVCGVLKGGILLGSAVCRTPNCNVTECL